MPREVRLSRPGKCCGSTCLRALRMVKFIETENRMVRARGWVQEQEGMGGSLLMGAEFQLENVGRVLGTAGDGDGRAA